MTNLRACNLCTEVRPMAATWFFVTVGKTEPSDWQMAEHWCVDCMKAVREVMADVTGVRHNT